MTKYVTFEGSAPVVDFPSKSVTMTVGVKNASMCRIPAPHVCFELTSYATLTIEEVTSYEPTGGEPSL